MKYCDLNVSFDAGDSWEYESKNKTHPLRFGDVLLADEKFKEYKSKFRSELEKTILEPLDHCESEAQISQTLDPIFERLSKSYFMPDAVNDDLLLKKANKNTLDKKLKEWCRQLNFNVPIVKNTPGTSIFYNKLKNVPCVVVAAGPSLANSIDKLKSIQGKCVIMSVDTSFRSCYKRDIIPTFCNAHDANENGKRFFMNQPCPETIGLFVNYIHPATIASYKGPLCFYYVGDDGVPVYQTMAQACDKDNHPGGSFMLSQVTGGSSVAHTAYYIALLMGCSPITFIGLDLSYPDLEKSHFETDNPKNVKAQKLIDVENIQGKKVKTNLSFYSYKTVMEKMAEPMAQIYNSKVFNSTEDEHGEVTGIIQRGIKPLRFNDFIDLYCTKEFQEIKKIKEIYEGAKNGKSL